MRIKSITLKNFKKHKDASFQFEEGSNMVVGPNYAGKSSIMQAILIGLFGNTAVSVTSSELVSTGSTDFSIALEFDNGTVVKRSLRNSSVARAGEEPYARGHSAVNTAMVELLGVNKDTFSKVFSSEQGSPQKLLDMEGAELQRFIESVIGIDKLDLVMKACNRKISSCKDMTSALEHLILGPEAFATTFGSYRRLIADIDDGRRELDKVEQSYKGAVEAKHRLSNKVAQARTSNKAIEAFESQQATIIARINGRTLAELEDTAELEKIVATKSAELKQAESAYRAWTNYERESNRLDAALAELPTVTPTHGLEGELASLISHLGKVEDSYRLYNRLTAEAAKAIPSEALEEVVNISELQEAIAVLRSDLVKAKALEKGAACPTCKRPFEDHDPIALAIEVSELTTTLSSKTHLLRIAEEHEHYNNLKAQLEALGELEDLESLRKTAEAKRVSLRDLQDNNTLRLRAEKDRAALDAVPVADEPETLRLEVVKLSDELKSIQLNNRVLSTTNEEVSRLQQQLSSLVRPIGDKVDLEPLESELAELARKESELRDLQHSLKQQESSFKLQMQPLEMALKQHHETTDKCKEFFGIIEDASYLYQLLSNSRESFIASSLHTVFSVTTEFTKLATGGDIEEIIFDGAIKYREEGILRGKGLASGAQQSLIGLGMKLGVGNLVTSHLNCLLLDEVSAAMSEDISLQAALAMESLCEQSISISHRQLDVAGNVIVL